MVALHRNLNGPVNRYSSYNLIYKEAEVSARSHIEKYKISPRKNQCLMVHDEY